MMTSGSVLEGYSFYVDESPIGKGKLIAIQYTITRIIGSNPILSVLYTHNYGAFYFPSIVSEDVI